MRHRHRGHALRRRYGRALLSRMGDVPQGQKETIHGTLTSVDSMGHKVTITTADRSEQVEFLDPRYWDTGSSARAYQALLNLKKLVGRAVTAEVEYHSAFGWTIFGRKKIKVS